MKRKRTRKPDTSILRDTEQIAALYAFIFSEQLRRVARACNRLLDLKTIVEPISSASHEWRRR